MAANKSERVLVDEWRDILALHARTLCELDRELHRHGLGASDFEVLDILAEGAAEDGGCAYRVQELAARVHLSQSALGTGAPVPASCAAAASKCPSAARVLM